MEIDYSPEFEKWFEGWLSRHKGELADLHKRAMWDAWQKRAAQQSVQSDVLPCGHDPNNLRLGDDGIYGCAECLATRR